jgi:hypothetical protein
MWQNIYIPLLLFHPTSAIKSSKSEYKFVLTSYFGGSIALGKITRFEISSAMK